MPADALIVGRADAGFPCVFIPGKDGGSSGWAPAKRLQSVATAAALADWTGTWKDGETH